MATYITKIRTESGDMQIDYNALANLPDLPTPESIGAASEKHTHSYGELTDTPTIPTKTSELENDSSFITAYENTTYTLTKSGSTITLTGSDGSKTSVTDADTNTTYSLSSFGITATATELNYMDGVTSAVQTQLNAKAASSHNHSASNITSGTLAVARGGTGQTTGNAALKAFLAAGPMILSSYQYGDTEPTNPAPVEGQLFFKFIE